MRKRAVCVRLSMSPHKRYCAVAARRGCDVGDVSDMSEGTFEFRMDEKRPQHTDGDLVEALRRFGESVGGRAFLIREFEGWKERPCSTGTVIARFGSWRKALEFAGWKGGRAKCYSPAELIENLERVWRAMGRRPGSVQLAKQGEFSAGPYSRHWGTVKRACAMVVKFHRGEITREELLAGGGAERPPASQRKGIPLELRWKILKRDRYRCTACGKSPATDPNVELEIDHIVPVAAGGKNEESNLRVLCSCCNRGKGKKID